MSFPNPTVIRATDWSQAFSRAPLDITLSVSGVVLAKSTNVVQGWARARTRGYPMTAALGSTSSTVTVYSSGKNIMY